MQLKNEDLLGSTYLIIYCQSEQKTALWIQYFLLKSMFLTGSEYSCNELLSYP